MITVEASAIVVEDISEDGEPQWVVRVGRSSLAYCDSKREADLYAAGLIKLAVTLRMQPAKDNREGSGT